MCALIFLIGSMIQVGMAIKCFNCDSAIDERCANMTGINLVAEECTQEKLNELAGGYQDDRKHWLLKISDNQYHPTKNEFDAPMTCQKIIGLDENKKRMTVRRCQFKNIDPCNFTQIQLTNRKEIEHCSVCNENGCNVSSNNQVFGVLIGVVSTLTISVQLMDLWN